MIDALSPVLVARAPEPSVLRRAYDGLVDLVLLVVVVLAFPATMLLLGLSIALLVKAVTGVASLF